MKTEIKTIFLRVQNLEQKRNILFYLKLIFLKKRKITIFSSDIIWYDRGFLPYPILMFKTEMKNGENYTVRKRK